MLPPALRPAQTLELVQRLRAGDLSAKEELINGHMRYVFVLVSRLCYLPQYQEELTSIGYEELCNAVNRISEGHLTHDNATAYIRRFVKGRVLRELSGYLREQRSELAEREYITQDEVTTLDYLDSIAQTAMDAQIMRLAILGYTNSEIGKRVNRSSAFVGIKKQELYSRYLEKERNDS